MDDDARSPPSHFFTLRLWLEKGQNNEPVWRGRAQHIASEEVSYFQGWEALQEILRVWMEEKA